MATLRIGTPLVDMPEPAHGGFKVSLQDIDAANSGRSANGTMIRDRVCGGASAKRKLEITWPPMETTDVSTLLQAVKDTYFQVEYPDPYTGERREGTFYAGDRSVPAYWNMNGTILWENVAFNLIEK